MPDLPLPFIDNMRALLGDEAALFFNALNQPFAAALRLNPRRSGAEAEAAPFIGDAVPWCPAGRYIREGTRPGLSPLHAAGAYSRLLLSHSRQQIITDTVFFTSLNENILVRCGS